MSTVDTERVLLSGPDRYAYGASPHLIRESIMRLLVLLDPRAGREGVAPEVAAEIETLCREVLAIKDRAYVYAADADRRANEAIRRAGDCTDHATALNDYAVQVSRLDRENTSLDEQRMAWIAAMQTAVDAHPEVKPYLEPYLERASRRQTAIRRRYEL